MTTNQVDCLSKEELSNLRSLMFYNHPYGEDNFSIIIKCRKCYDAWLLKYQGGKIKVSMYELSRVDYCARNIISMIELIEEGMPKPNLILARKALSEYMSEINIRYVELQKELEKVT